MSKEPKQVFSFSVIGKPSTKKRPRVVAGVSKSGKAYSRKFTPDAWYEDMVREAFLSVYPHSDFKPIGWSFCEPNEDPNKYMWTKKANVRDNQLPKVEVDMVFYFNGGKLGDLDNYIKAIMDALNDYAYIDDRQVKHFKPYIINLKDYDELLEEDETMLQEYTTVERVDILVRHYEFEKDKMFLALRKYFKKNSDVVDLTEKYYGEE